MLLLYHACCFIFFFQAEDGIRDWSVTGVQTCALPISLKTPGETFSDFRPRRFHPAFSRSRSNRTLPPANITSSVRSAAPARSSTLASSNQIGRACVGKECSVVGLLMH